MKRKARTRKDGGGRGTVLAIDLGGTLIRGARVDTGGRIRDRREMPTPKGRAPRAVVSEIARILTALAKAGRRRGGHVEGIGIGVPGLVDVGNESVVHSPNFPLWRRYALGQNLRATLRRVPTLRGVPIFLENDANAAALGEFWVGAGRGVRSFILFTLGTGVGGGVMLDGRLLHGEEGFAGELGHIVIDRDGVPCAHGGRGCLETFAGSLGIQRLGRQRGAIPQGGSVETEALARRARQGDRAARAVFSDVGHALGLAIADYMHIFNMKHFILGGRVASASDLFMRALRRAIRLQAYPASARGVRVVRAQKGGEAGLLGAAFLAWAGIGQSVAEGEEAAEGIRPWGSWRLLDAASGHKVKRIRLNPGARFSYQRHRHRTEHWTVVRGLAKVTLDGRTVRVSRNESIEVPRGTVHRMANPRTSPLEFIEVQVGRDLAESDIIRLEDDYGRARARRKRGDR